MSNLEVMRTFEIVSIVIFVIAAVWLYRQRNPLYMGAFLGALTVYGYDWMWSTKGFFNATFNPDLIAIPGMNVMGITEPYAIPLNYAFGFGIPPVLLVMAKDWFDRKFGVWHYAVIWLMGVVAIALYEIPVVHILKAWTYHQKPEFLIYGFPWSNFWLAANMVMFSYAGLRWAERWAALPARAGFALNRETTWKGYVMGIGAIWSAFYLTQLIQMFWYGSGMDFYVESGRPF